VEQAKLSISQRSHRYENKFISNGYNCSSRRVLFCRIRWKFSKIYFSNYLISKKSNKINRKIRGQGSGVRVQGKWERAESWKQELENRKEERAEDGDQKSEVGGRKAEDQG
jgi:hypothetical protein